MSGGAWGYICPLLRQGTTNKVLEFCWEQWRIGTGFPGTNTNFDVSAACANTTNFIFDQTITDYASNTKFATEMAGSANTFVFEKNPSTRTFTGYITEANLDAAIKATNEHCGAGYSEVPSEYVLVGIEQGMEGGHLSELGGYTEDLQARTEYSHYQIPPSASTSEATEIKRTEATVHGNANANGSESHAYFQYGTTPSYGKDIPELPGWPIGSGTGNVPAYTTLTGLEPGTTYHYRLVATSPYGTTYGNDETFTTPGPPRAVTEAATGIKPTEATLNGSVNPNTYATNYYFQYGPTTSYGSIVPTGGAGVGSGTTPVPLSNTITGLAPGSPYHYRIVAENYNGEWGYGEDKTFNTPVARTNVFFADSKHGDTMTDRWFSGGWFETNFGGGEMAKGTAASGGMVGGAANVLFANAGESDKMADRWMSPTGWLQTNFGGDEIAKGSSPFTLMAGNEPNVFFVDAKEKNTLAAWLGHEGWKQSAFGGDEVAAGTSPSGVMVGSEANVFFVDAKEKDTLTDRWYHEGWKQSHLGKDEVAKGTSPDAVMIGSDANVFFVDASKGNTLTDLSYSPTLGWQEVNLGGDEVAAGTSPSAVLVGSEPNVFFVDAKEKDTLTDRWDNPAGWKQSPFGGDEVAAGTSPSAVMVGSEANVFFVDAKEKDTLTDRWYHEGWKQSPFGGDEVAAGSSPSALEE